jgi:hypothetical protein
MGSLSRSSRSSSLFPCSCPLAFRLLIGKSILIAFFSINAEYWTNRCGDGVGFEEKVSLSAPATLGSSVKTPQAIRGKDVFRSGTLAMTHDVHEGHRTASEHPVLPGQPALRRNNVHQSNWLLYLGNIFFH